MKRNFLEELGLDKETVDKILDENSADIGKAKGDTAKLDSEITALKNENESLKANLSDRDTQLEELKRSAGNSEELQKQIENLQVENKTKDEAYQAEIKQIKIENAVKEAISAANGRNTKAISALLDLESVELGEDGSIKGLSEQIESLQKSDDSKFLFESPKRTIKGARVGDPSDPLDQKVDFSKMTYEEIAAYMDTNEGAQE